MNNYKGHMDNNKERWKQRKEVGRAGVVWWGREKRQKTVLAQQIKKVLKMFRGVHSHFPNQLQISSLVKGVHRNV